MMIQHFDYMVGYDICHYILFYLLLKSCFFLLFFFKFQTDFIISSHINRRLLNNKNLSWFKW